MANSTASNSMTRRQVLITGIQIAAAIVPTSLLFGCGEAVDSQKSGNELDTRLHRELVDASKPASAGGQWTELEFNALIDSMGEDSLKRTSKTLEVSPALVENYTSTTIMKREIRKHIASASNSLLSGRNPDKIQYHERVLLPTARKLNVEETQIDTYDTLQLEKATV